MIPVSARALRSVLLVIAWVLFASSCSDSEDPQVIAGDFIIKAEAAFEKRSSRALRALVSPIYFDEKERSDQDVIAIGSAYILRASSIHIFFSLESVSRNEEFINALVLVALASRPIDNRSLLPQINADIYWFDIVLSEYEGTWKLLSADWRQAMLDDVIGGN